MEIVGSNPIGVAIQTHMKQKKYVETIIIGAGLSGIAAGKTLLSKNRDFIIIEQKNKIGGKLNTVIHNGYKLDYGFQIILDGYENTKKNIDIKKLKLQYFDSGALIWDGKKFHTIADPFKNIKELPITIISPIGNLKDKIKILILKIKLIFMKENQILQMDNITTKSFFKKNGFSSEFINKFLQPFFSGILLDKNLITPHTYMLYLFKLFSRSNAGVPINGMQEIPSLLARELPKDKLMLNTKVKKIENDKITLENNQIIYCKNIICSIESNSIKMLEQKNNIETRKYFSCTTHYFASAHLNNIFGKAYNTKKIILNGSGRGQINNIAIMSNIAKSYAPNGSNLIAITTLGKKTDHEQIVNELQGWSHFNNDDIMHLKSIHIDEALPIYSPDNNQKNNRFENIIYCGDYLFHPSIEGAISSGIKAGDQIN